MKQIEYTLCVTSCARHDLLAITLESYFRNVDVQPIRKILIEDGPTIPELDSSWEILHNEPRIGQIKSCDRLMAACDSEFLVWQEDDWLFKDGNFIMPSLAILERFPEIFTVGLRGHAWNHPLIVNKSEHAREYPDLPFLIAEPGWQGGWGGMAFNPGLRRKSDYLKMGSYASLGGTDMYACQSELAISKKYLAAGYRIADLGRPIIEHLGHGRSKTKEKF